MDKLLGSLKALVRPPTVVTDNAVFRLHYKVTVPLLVAFSLLVTSRQHLGDPIDCISRDDIPTELLDTFCWVHSTFSVADAWHAPVGPSGVPYPGVDTHAPGERRVYHAYYQWVCFVLFLQALLFYAPRQLWKGAENGRVRALVGELDAPAVDPERRREHLRLLVAYVAATRGRNGVLLLQHAAGEVLNAVNAAAQMLLTDAFLGGTFAVYGAAVMRFSEWDWAPRYDPMLEVFPRLAKCTFHRYGSSGDVQRHDAMCILPLNILNEKIYVVLWFWFVALAALSWVAVGHRAALFLSREMRARALRPGAGPAPPPEQLRALSERLSPGDHFVVHLLSKNLHAVHYREFVAELLRVLGGPPRAEKAA